MDYILYNCCEDDRPPAFALFDSIEWHACRTYDGEVAHVDRDDLDAEFYCVYGHYDPTKSHRQGLEAITDCPTLALALVVTQLFEYGLAHPPGRPSTPVVF